ncbi:MAG: ATP-dependent Clp protease adaptor ClpS [Acidobacteria bacterium]|nr:ATP-dependent Clp protease adaptor ClpS [Acidobacteriota bacterium]
MTGPEGRHEQLQRSLAEHVHGYAVILHHDDVNSMEHVVDALLKSVPTLSEQDAVRVMMDAHTEGRAVITICPLETAEFYRDRLQSFSLGASIEST